MKKITLKFLESIYACQSGISKVRDWGFLNLPADKFIKALMEHNRFDYANWLIVRVFSTKKKKVQYAVFAAKTVLNIYEEKYPNDDRPRKAIEAAENYLRKPNQFATGCRSAAAAATEAAVAAVATADVAVAEAVFAANAAVAAANAAADVADAAVAGAVFAANVAAVAAADVAVVKTKIIEYGLSLLKKRI